MYTQSPFDQALGYLETSPRRTAFQSSFQALGGHSASRFASSRFVRRATYAAITATAAGVHAGHPLGLSQRPWPDLAETFYDLSRQPRHASVLEVHRDRPGLLPPTPLGRLLLALEIAGVLELRFDTRDIDVRLACSYLQMYLPASHQRRQSRARPPQRV